MPEPVRTPITQALQDGAISRRELKMLMQRSNLPAFRHLALWLVLLLITGSTIAFTVSTIWMIPAMFVHGIIIVHHFSLQHECCHYTVFRTRWLNDAVGWFCGVVINVPGQHFRYEHCDHHTYTQLTGHDPEQIPLPTTFWSYLKYISAIPYITAQWRGLVRHAFGRIHESETHFLPKETQRIIFLEARLMLTFYVGLLVFCLATGWAGPLWYWVIPYLMGEPVMRAIRMTEHVGRPNVDDLRENTRTNLVSRPFQFLCWNMNYHAEHHYASSVPFHALPKLHKKLDGYIFVETGGYLGAHKDILAQLFGRKPRSDVNRVQ